MDESGISTFHQQPSPGSECPRVQVLDAQKACATKSHALHGIQDCHCRVCEVGDVAGNNGEVMLKSGCCQQPIDGRKGTPLALGLGCEQSPAVGDRAIDN